MEPAELATQSYWEDSSSVSRYRALDRNVTVDVVVVGAGITGLTAAYLIKQSGQRVAVIDRRRAGGVDSALTTAHVTNVTDVDLSELVKSFGRDHAWAAWDAGLAAIEQIDRTIQREEIECELDHFVLHVGAALGAAAPGRFTKQGGAKDLRIA